MSLTHTITILELVWTLSALFGLVFTVKLLVRSVGDYYWLLDSNANGEREVRKNVGITSMIIFGGGVFTQFIYFIIGILAMTQPNLHLTTVRVISSLFFICGSIVGSILAGVIYKRRTSIIVDIVENYVKREHGHGRPGTADAE